MRKLSAIKENCFTVKILDVVTTEFDVESDDPIDCLFLVMDFVEDKFQQILDRDEEVTFTEDHLIVVIYNLLCSANFLHSANVMHRDLKPENILIDKECMTKICDFGLSRACIEPYYPDMK